MTTQTNTTTENADKVLRSNGGVTALANDPKGFGYLAIADGAIAPYIAGNGDDFDPAKPHASLKTGTRIYQLIGTVGTEEQGGEPIPFAVGQHVKTARGHYVRIIHQTREGRLFAARLADDSVGSFDRNGNGLSCDDYLLPMRKPARAVRRLMPPAKAAAKAAPAPTKPGERQGGLQIVGPVRIEFDTDAGRSYAI